MKACPSCSQLYAGDQIRFCRWDGGTLQPVVVTLDDETTRELLRKHTYQKTSAQLRGSSARRRLVEKVS